MSDDFQTEAAGTDPRIAALIEKMRAVEQEPTEGRLEAITAAAGAPFLLSEAQEQPRLQEAAQWQAVEMQLAILNALPAHIALLDTEGVILVVNEAWRRFASANSLQSTGFLVGQNYIGVCEMAHGDCAEEAQLTAAGIRQVLSGELKEFALEYPCHSPTEQRWFRLIVTPLSEHQKAGAVVMHVNVTERWQAEKILQENQQRLEIEAQRLHESQIVAGIGSWECDLSTLDSIWTAQTHRIFETCPDHFIPSHRQFLERVHPDDRAMVNAAFVESFGKSGRFSIEHRLLLPDGRIKHVEERWHNFHDAEDRPARAIGTCQDITERKLAAESLAESQALLRIAGKTARLGGWSIDVHDNCQRWSEEIRMILDVEPGHTPSLAEALQFYPTKYREEVIRHVEGCAREGTPFDIEVEIITAKKRRIWVRAIGEAVRDRNGQIRCIQGAFQDISQQKQAEVKVRASEASLVQAQRIARIGNWDWNIEKNELYWSAQVFELFGIIPSEFGSNYEAFLQGVHPEDRERTHQAVQDALAGKVPYNIDHRVLWPDGTVRVMHEQGEVTSDAEGRALKMTGTVQDITESKLAAGAVQASELRFRGLFEQASVGMCIFAKDGRFLRTNQRFCDILGYSAEELLNLSCADITHADDQPREADTIIQLLAGEIESAAWEKRHLHRSGRAVWCHLTLSQLPPDAGEAREFVGVVVDITKRRRAEEALRESEERFRLMIEGSEQVLFYTHDREHRFEYLSPSTLAVLGYEPAELVGQLCDTLLIQEDAANDDIRRLTDQAMQDGKACEPYLVMVRHKDGRRLVLEILASPIVNEGRIMGIQGFARDITEREVARSALAASEREFRNLAESMPQIVWVTRPDGWNTYFNQHWIDYTGLSLEESLGHGWSRPFHPNDQPRAWAAWQEAITTGTTYALECRLRRADGSYRWWLIRGEPQRNTAGQVIKWFGTCTDIHDLKVAEMEVTRTNRALKLLSGCNEALIHAEDEATLLRDVCQLAVDTGRYRMAWVGYAMDDAARSIQPMAHAGVEDGYLAEINVNWDPQSPSGKGPGGQTIRSGQAVVSADMQLDPHFHSLEAARQRGYRAVICLPLRDKQRTFGLLGLYSAEVNVTNEEEQRLLQEMADNLAFGILNLRLRQEQRQADERLREQATLLDKAQDAILVRDLDHQILYWNRSAERLYGWTAAEAVGRDALALLYQDIRPVEAAVTQLMADGEWVGEMHQVTKDGRQLTVEAHWSLVRDDQGKPKSILAINTDVTERKKIEAQYLRAQRMESIGTLAGGIAHDLNNVLAPIMMSIELLKMQEKDDRRMNILTTIEGSARRGADMVRQVLSFARGVEGRQLEVEVGHLIEEIQKIAQDTFLKNIEVRGNIPTDLWAVQGDPTQLHQVLLNLCVNARDAMPSGGTLSLSASNLMLDEQYAGMNIEAKPGPYVRIVVEDSGTGMPPDVLERIFEPFFTTKELGKGTGLGLSTTIAIIKSHNGFVRVYSEVGTGTRFHLYLPAHTKTGAANAEPAPVELPRGSGELVLVIDDEAAVRQITRQTLEAFGYRVVLASDGVEATSIYATRKHEIAVVLTDMMMPLMDGPTTIQVLLRLNPQARIIAASGLNANGMVAKAASAGVNHFIPKPYTAETLLKTLRSRLEECMPGR